MLIREKTMIFLDYALTGLQYISISVTLTAILSWCDIYFAMKNILRDLEVWCGVFNAVPKNTRICQKNLLRLLGVEVRSHTLAIQKNNLAVVCSQIFLIYDTVCPQGWPREPQKKNRGLDHTNRSLDPAGFVERRK